MIKSISYSFNQTIIAALVFLSLIIAHRDANANVFSVIIKQLDNIINAGNIGRISAHSYKIYERNKNNKCKEHPWCKKFNKEIKLKNYKKLELK